MQWGRGFQRQWNLCAALRQRASQPAASRSWAAIAAMHSSALRPPRLHSDDACAAQAVGSATWQERLFKPLRTEEARSHLLQPVNNKCHLIRGSSYGHLPRKSWMSLRCVHSHYIAFLPTIWVAAAVVGIERAVFYLHSLYYY
jgi:hypothetical protein